MKRKIFILSAALLTFAPQQPVNAAASTSVRFIPLTPETRGLLPERLAVGAIEYAIIGNTVHLNHSSTANRRHTSFSGSDADAFIAGVRTAVIPASTTVHSA